MSMQVMIDDREKQDRIKKAVEYYTDKEYEVFVTENIYGDYIFHDTCTNLDVAFEYKTLEDFISSIQDNRVFNQALNQSNHFEYHFVIVVGTDQEKSKVIRDKQRYTGNYVTNEQFYGAYASLVNVTSLIQVPNEKIAFMVMGKVAEKCCSKKPVVKRFVKSRGSPALRLLTNNITGIGYITAERICAELGLYSIENVFDIGMEDLLQVDGVGVKTAKKILKQLHTEFQEGEYGH